ncbi:MAG: hypothetical protein ACOYL6_14980 [Bacteriovoracaceae bacterium]
MKTVILLTVLFISISSFSQIIASNDVAQIKLRALLWSRPLAPGNELNYTYYGQMEDIQMSLSANLGLQRDEVIFTRDAYTISVRSFRINKSGAEPYLILQSKITNKDKMLVAECSTYSSLGRIMELGIGACTGRVGDLQLGVSYTH